MAADLEPLAPRVPVRVAAKYLGRSVRWVEQAIREGRLRAIDLSRPGAKRASWAIAVHDLRSFLAEADARGRERLAEAQGAKEAQGAQGEGRKPCRRRPARANVST